LEEVKKITLELTVNEAIIIRNALANGIPMQSDEMITLMLFEKITFKIKEAISKNATK
jgi:hypothetical protein